MLDVMFYTLVANNHRRKYLASIHKSEESGKQFVEITVYYLKSKKIMINNEELLRNKNDYKLLL